MAERSRVPPEEGFEGKRGSPLQRNHRVAANPNGSHGWNSRPRMLTRYVRSLGLIEANTQHLNLMPIDSIIRVSFEGHPPANQAANNALVGHAQNAVGPRPFRRIGTALYSCNGADEIPVAQCLQDLGNALADHADLIDFVSITLARRPAVPAVPAPPVEE
jgi:hypothetical protein